jgi:fluoroquinolone resistance protein
MATDDCTFDNVGFEECKLTGINFSKINNFIFSASFVHCILDYAIFEKNDLNHSLFNRCSIREACFIEANLKSAKFQECDLCRTIFDQANIEKADFSTSKNYFIDLDKNKVKGARFSLPEAVNLLLKYEIEIK